MGKLDELRKFVSESFTKEGQTAEDVKKLAQLEKLISDSEEENKKTLDANKELVNAYRDLINHTAGDIKEDKNNPTAPNKELPDFDKALANWTNGYDIFGENLRDKEK